MLGGGGLAHKTFFGFPQNSLGGVAYVATVSVVEGLLESEDAQRP